MPTTNAYDRVSRLAVMLVPRAGLTDAELAKALVEGKPQIAKIFGSEAHIRIGAKCKNDPLSASMGENRKPGTLSAAIEVTMAEAQLQQLAGGAEQLGRLLQPLIDPAQAALTVGITYRILLPRDGAVFLSLSFKRYPDTSIEAFRKWWLEQHSKVAAPLLLPLLLAYDQVHVDHELSCQASARASLPYVPYDAYDNLTWASRQAYIDSVSDPDSMRKIYEDELGHIDHATYRGALMNELA